MNIKHTALIVYSLVAIYFLFNSFLTNYNVNNVTQINTGIAEAKTPLTIENYEAEIQLKEIKHYKGAIESSLIKKELEKHLNEDEVEIMLKISSLESGNRLDAIPPTKVLHCQRIDGSYYAIELMERNGLMVQATCGNDTQVYSEVSYGLFQILQSTAKRQCNGLDILKADMVEQVKCAVSIYQQSGYGAWATYSKIK